MFEGLQRMPSIIFVVQVVLGVEPDDMKNVVDGETMDAPVFSSRHHELDRVLVAQVCRETCKSVRFCSCIETLY
jgi:hypothetical protein